MNGRLDRPTQAIVRTVSDELAQIEAAQRDRRAFAPLYEAYVDLVWAYAMRRLGNTELATEVTSLTFARALAALNRFDPRSDTRGTAFRGWLMTIARNTLVDIMRCQRPTASLHDPSIQLHLADDHRTPEELALADEERQRVLAALQQLPPSQRRIVELRLSGLKSAEIADQLGMSVSAVNTAHFRAFERLRDLLADAAVDRGVPR